jgi:hypothetical protein
MEIHDRLLSLKRLNIGDKVLDIYAASIHDLALLAEIEDELNPQQQEGTTDGTGSEMAAEC